MSESPNPGTDRGSVFFRLSHALLTFVIERYRFTLAISALLLILLGVSASHLEVDFNVESLFPRDDGKRLAFSQYIETFGRDDDLIILLCQPRIASTAALVPLRDLAAALRRQEVFSHVYSLFDVPRPMIRDEIEFTMDRLENWLLASDTPRPDRFGDLTASLTRSHPVCHNFYAPASQTFILLLRLSANFADNQGRIRAVTNLRQWLADSSFSQSFTCTLGGMPVARADGMVLIERDQKRLLPFALLVNILTLWWLFGHWLNVTLVLLHVLFTLTVTLGCMGFLGWRFSILSSVMPVILIITASSYSIHLLSRWRREQQRENPLPMVAVFAEMVKPVGLATLTTIVGFLSLAKADMQLITEFALLTSGGVAIAFLLSMLVFPALVQAFPSPSRSNPTSQRGADKVPGQRLLDQLLLRISRVNIRSPRLIVGFLLVIGLLSLFHGLRVQVRAFVFDDFSPGSVFMRDIRLSEAACDGILPMAVTIAAPEKVVALRLHYLQKSALIARYLRSRAEVGKVDSPSDMVSEVFGLLTEQPTSGGTLLPESDSELGHVVRMLLANGTIDPGIRLLSKDLGSLQVQFRLHDLESSRAAHFIDELRAYLLTLEDRQTHISLNGTTLMIQEAYRNILSSLLTGFVLVIGFTLLVFLFTFSHLPTVIAAFLGNLFPVCMILALMAWCDISFKPSTVTVFGIALGLAVDNTIYFLREYMRYLHQGFSPVFAVRHGLFHAGPGMIISSLALGSGFLVLLFSEFEAQFLIGLLLSFSVAIALMYDLFFVPAAMVLFGPKRV